MKWEALSILPLNKGERRNYFSLTRILNNGVGGPQGKIIVIEYACYSKNGIVDKMNLILFYKSMQHHIMH